jgi:hypothetical protein
VERVLAGFGPIGEVGMRRRLVEVQRLDILGDRADQTLAQRQLGDMEQTSLFSASPMMFTTELSFACAGARDAIRSCRRVRISRAEAAADTGMRWR